LGDKFSQVALKRTTAGVNFFRIIQPTEQDGDEADDSHPEEGWSTIEDDRKIQDADTIHFEIEKDNKMFRLSDTVNEKTFDVQVRHPICKMRKDTQLVLIDIPGINEAESSKKYKEYVKSNWNTFDCVVVVMDAIQGVNTEEQVDLLKFVNENNQESKDIPTIILGNKMDDLNDEDTIHQIEETRLKIIEIFGCNAWVWGPKDTNFESIKTAFIPLSAKNAFTYMKAGSINLDELKNTKNCDIVNKIGQDEYGRKWSRMKLQEKLDTIMGILSDPSELNERLAGTNFNCFLEALSNFVGGHAKQREILAKQIKVSLNDICYRSIDTSISEYILQAYKCYKSIGETNIDDLKETFWILYRACVEATFDGCQSVVDPSTMARPFLELQNYHELTVKLEWENESKNVIGKMKELLRRQISFLLQKIEQWSFENYCRLAGGSACADNNSYYSTCDRCKRYSVHDCQEVVTHQNVENAYLICRRSDQGLVWKDGWKAPETIEWTNLSPEEWMIILESLLLVWDQKCFVDGFGLDKMKLSAVLNSLYTTFRPGFGISHESCITSNPMDRVCLRAYREEIKLNKKESAIYKTRFDNPDSLDNPSHWGFLAWKYFNFCENEKSSEPKKKRVKLE